MASARERARKAKLDKSRSLARATPHLEAAPAEPKRVIGGPATNGVIDRDGWEWLKARSTLSLRQLNAGDDYRFAYRAQGGVPLKSCINPDMTGGGGSGARAFQPPIMETPYEAKRWLFRVHFEILAGQPDMMAALDAVCARGLMIRDFTTNSYEAKAIENLLKVALDLVGRHLDPKVRRVA